VKKEKKEQKKSKNNNYVSHVNKDVAPEKEPQYVYPGLKSRTRLGLDSPISEGRGPDC
jgi:hypothetical protein